MSLSHSSHLIRDTQKLIYQWDRLRDQSWNHFTLSEALFIQSIEKILVKEAEKGEELIILDQMIKMEREYHLHLRRWCDRQGFEELKNASHNVDELLSSVWEKTRVAAEQVIQSDLNVFSAVFYHVHLEYAENKNLWLSKGKIFTRLQVRSLGLKSINRFRLC